MGLPVASAAGSPPSIFYLDSPRSLPHIPPLNSFHPETDLARPNY